MARKGKAEVLIDIKGDSKDLDNAVKKSNKSLKSIGDSASKAATNMAKMGLATAGIAAAFSVVAVKQALTFDGLDRAFKRLVTQQGGDADKFMVKMKEMSSNTVSEMSIMKKANMGLMLGLKPDTLITFMEAATTIAQSTGESVDYMFESLTTGTARQSKLWLDNLGILINVDKANQAYADTLGVEVSELDENQRKLAFVNAAMSEAEKKTKDLGGAMKDTNMKWGEMKAWVSDLTVSFGQKLMPEFDKVLDWFLSNKDWMIQSFKDIFRVDTTNIGEKVVESLDEVKKWTDDNQDTLSGVWDTFVTATDMAITAVKTLIASVAVMYASGQVWKSGGADEDIKTLIKAGNMLGELSQETGQKEWAIGIADVFRGGADEQVDGATPLWRTISAAERMRALKTDPNALADLYANGTRPSPMETPSMWKKGDTILGDVKLIIDQTALSSLYQTGTANATLTNV